MTDEVARAAVVLGVVVVALAIAFVQRSGASIRRASRSFEGMEPGIYLFSSETCSSCDVMRSRLRGLGLGFREIEVEADPTLFRRHRIDKVPAVARVRDDGSGWLAVGIVSPARARRWLSSP